LAIIFKKTVKNYLRNIFVGFIRSGNNRINMLRLADDALNIFVSVFGNCLGFGNIKKYTPADGGSQKNKKQQVEEQFLFKIKNIYYFWPFFDRWPRQIYNTNKFVLLINQLG